MAEFCDQCSVKLFGRNFKGITMGGKTMVKKELDDRERFPYLDPLLSWWELAGGVILLLGVVALAYVLLWM